MRHDRYGFSVDLTLDFDRAIERVTEALRREGFGVLSDIDVQATLERKLGVDHPRYRILGACNPPLAHQALLADPDIGLLLPCNVIVRETGTGVRVVLTDPSALFSVVGRDDMLDMVRAVEDKLKRVAAALEGPEPTR